MIYSVDSISEGIARLLPQGGTPILVYCSLLPPDCREGSLLCGEPGRGFSLLECETERARAGLFARFQALAEKRHE